MANNRMFLVHIPAGLAAPLGKSMKQDGEDNGFKPATWQEQYLDALNADYHSELPCIPSLLCSRCGKPAVGFIREIDKSNPWMIQALPYQFTLGVITAWCEEHDMKTMHET